MFTENLQVTNMKKEEYSYKGGKVILDPDLHGDVLWFAFFNGNEVASGKEKTKTLAKQYAENTLTLRKNCPDLSMLPTSKVVSTDEGHKLVPTETISSYDDLIRKKPTSMGLDIRSLSQLVDVLKHGGKGHENDVISFGKHRGKKLSEVDSGYKHWAIKEIEKTEFENDTSHVSCEHCRKNTYVRDIKSSDLLNIYSTDGYGRYGADTLTYICRHCNKQSDSIVYL